MTNPSPQAGVEPLSRYLPERDDPYVPPMERALANAQQTLDRFWDANIHDRDAMIRAAVALASHLHQLVAAHAPGVAMCDLPEAWRKQVTAA